MSIPHQYFAPANVAAQCISAFVEKVGPDTCKDIQVIIAPSCRDSLFLKPIQEDKQLSNARLISIEVAPTLEYEEMTLADHLDLKLDFEASPPDVTAVIGNPPFGSNGSIAAQYLVSAAEIADYIALILPEHFCSIEHIHHSMPPDVQLVWSEELPRDVFELPDGTLYRTGACFQIWQRGDEEEE